MFENTSDRKRVSANPSPSPNSNSNSNPNPKAQYVFELMSFFERV